MWHTDEILHEDGTSMPAGAPITAVQSHVRLKPLENCLATGSYQSTCLHQLYAHTWPRPIRTKKKKMLQSYHVGFLIGRKLIKLIIAEITASSGTI